LATSRSACCGCAVARRSCCRRRHRPMRSGATDSHSPAPVDTRCTSQATTIDSRQAEFRRTGRSSQPEGIFTVAPPSECCADISAVSRVHHSHRSRGKHLSNGVPPSSRSSPTTPRCSASSSPLSSKTTMSGPSPNAAASQREFMARIHAHPLVQPNPEELTPDRHSVSNTVDVEPLEPAPTYTTQRDGICSTLRACPSKPNLIAIDDAPSHAG
jgi:hypothetical protein